MKQAVAAEKKNLVAIGRFIHGNPELGLNEFNAAEKLKAYLAALGYEVTAPYAGMKTAFRAVLKNGAAKPKIAVFAEYDALNGIGHACGHNLIATTALAAAAGMAGTRKYWKGQFEIIGTPAEEELAGKVRMIGKNAFSHLDCALMAHPHWRSVIGTGSTANRRATVSFYGKASHAAGDPQSGINALDAAILFFNGINSLRQHLREDARVHGIITNGGQACNVIPEFAEARIAVRSFDEDYLEVLRKRVRNCAVSAAKAIGARATVTWEKYYYFSYKVNQTLDEVLAGSLAEAGIFVARGTGRDERASLDMANVSRLLPAAHPFFGITPKKVGKVALHSEEFLRYADSDAGYDAAVSTGAGMALAAAKLFGDVRLLAKIKAEFGRG
jgi:amidohydrolase